MNVLLVDDHVLFREGLRHLLDGIGASIAFTEAGNIAELHDIRSPSQFDLVLLDYRLPDISGLEALAAVREVFSTATVVVVSGEDDPATIHEVISQGASGFIPKSSSTQILLAALKLVLAGGVYLPPALLSIGPGFSPTKNDVLQSLSLRQRQVLLEAIRGKANKVIARELDISDHTVKAHLAVAYRVLKVKNRSEAVYAAARLGIK